MNRKKNHQTRRTNPGAFLGSKLSFTATEAYKLLRTNLLYCVAEDKPCKCIGITSAVQGEGKSTTAINLAYMLAEDGKRTCIVEADLRAPNLAARLNATQGAGLSQVLAGIANGKGLIMPTELHSNLYVVPSGDVPPNPAELLGTKKMAGIISLLSERFDYIIVDLPPITVVSDALVVANLLDGMLMVVREGYCTRRDFDDAVQLLSVLGNKLLGYVVTHSAQKTGRYGKRYGHYRKYGSKYGSYYHADSRRS